MRLGAILAGFVAVLLHAGFVLFGGILLPEARPDHGTNREVELLDTAEDDPRDKPPDTPPPDVIEQKLAENDEPPPDAEKIVRSLMAETPTAPKLELASLSAIEAALSGKGGGEFGDALGFVQGGRIDGQGTRAIAASDQAEQSFNLAEIDQRPRAIFQTTPEYPSDMRGRKVEGAVTVLFVVDATGKVTQLRVEKVSHPAFEKPAVEAVRRWKFEPGIKAGQRVASKMRVTVRFAAD